MYRKSFHDYLESIQDPNDLICKYGHTKKELIENLQAPQLADQIAEQATAAILAAIKKSL